MGKLIFSKHTTLFERPSDVHKVYFDVQKNIFVLLAGNPIFSKRP